MLKKRHTENLSRSMSQCHIQLKVPSEMRSNHLHLAKGYYVGGLTGFREVRTATVVLKASNMRRVHPVARRGGV